MSEVLKFIVTADDKTGLSIKPFAGIERDGTRYVGFIVDDESQPELEVEFCSADRDILKRFVQQIVDVSDDILKL